MLKCFCEKYISIVAYWRLTFHKVDRVIDVHEKPFILAFQKAIVTKMFTLLVL